MSYQTERFIEGFVLIILAIVFLFIILVFAPISIANEAKCLSKGYPNSSTTITLKGYCINKARGKVVPL